MKLFKVIVACAAASAFFGCASRVPLLSLEYVSAKESKVNTRNAKSYGNAESACISVGKDGYGLMETAVNDALSKTPGATFLKDAKFTTTNTCVQVNGIAMGQN